ncbi:hypothetical protein [Larkinella knui]
MQDIIRSNFANLLRCGFWWACLHRVFENPEMHSGQPSGKAQPVIDRIRDRL